MQAQLKFGIFLAPFHHPRGNPTLALERDLALVQHVDRLGFDEAWIGEHHSSGFEIIAAPDIFIATAAERTSHIKLGTGVYSLSYHHPLIVTDRMILLDHLTRGRVMFGIGPGALVSDALMMGVDPSLQREMMEQSLEAIIALLKCDRPVNRKTDWFTLSDAYLQLRPYTRPHFDIAVAAMFSPTGPRVAGTYGIDLLSLGATSLEGFAALNSAWDVAEAQAAACGQTVSRAGWRVVGPMHLAETDEQARRDVAYGLEAWFHYFGVSRAVGMEPEGEGLDAMIDAINASGFGVIGSAERAIAQIERLQQQSGGFGTYLLMSHDWAPPEATHRSYEVFAREVMPHFQGSAEPLVQSWKRSMALREKAADSKRAAYERAAATHLAATAATGKVHP